jgi:hypothetical protein
MNTPITFKHSEHQITPATTPLIMQPFTHKMQHVICNMFQALQHEYTNHIQTFRTPNHASNNTMIQPFTHTMQHVICNMCEALQHDYQSHSDIQNTKSRQQQHHDTAIYTYNAACHLQHVSSITT